MKKSFLLTGIFLFAVVAIMAISKSSNPPEEAVRNFLKAINDEDWTTAKSLSTEESSDYVDVFEIFAALNDLTDEPPKAIDNDWNLEKIVCEIDGANSICSYVLNGEPGSINLVKLNGKWLIDERKESADFDFD